MALKTPIFLENDTTTQNADELRLERAYLIGGRSGAYTETSFAVTQRGAGANMSVDVAAGGIAVLGTENALQGAYHVTNDAVVNVVVPAADLTNPRKDLLIVKVRDSFYSGASNDAQLEYVSGTPAASPAEPNLGALGKLNYHVLALIDVPASDTAITNSQITDRRARATMQGGIVPATSGARPTVNLYEGLVIYESDTDLYQMYTGAAWQRFPWKAAWGIQAKHVLTSNSTGYTATGNTDMVMAAFAARDDRSYRLHLHSAVLMSTTGAWTLEFSAAGTDVGRAALLIDVSSILGGQVVASCLWNPATTTTYDLRIKANELSGSATLTLNGSATNPRQFWVEDIGARV